jgi:hypothetical protein
MKQNLAKILTLFTLTLSSLSLAQDYSGTYIADETDVLTLVQNADGSLSGQVMSGDIPFTLQGQVSPEGAFGSLTMNDGNQLIFGAVFSDANTLNFQIAPVDASGQPMMEQAFELSFIRQGNASNPLTQTPLSQESQNPLTLAPQNSQSTLSGQAIGPLQTYSSGQTVVSEAAGFSIIIPAGFSATYDAANGFLAFANADKSSGFALLAFSKGDMQSFASQLLELFAQNEEAQVSVVGTPQESADAVRATLSVFDPSSNQEVMVHLATRRGVDGNMIGLIGGGLPQDTSIAEAIDEVLASLVFSQPVVNAQTTQTLQTLTGKDLSKTGESSSFGSGINAPSLSGIDEETYTFCSKGDYGYSMTRQTFFSSDAGSFSSEDSDQHQGRWEVISGILSEPYLFLQATDGRFFLYRYNTLPEGIVINSSVFSVTSTNQCQ